MVEKLESKMEVVFGFFGIIFSNVFILMAVFFTPGYNPLFNTVSSLGEGPAKSLFSIAFVVAGTLGIPFFIYLERELTNIKESIRRLATGVSIFTCVCIALVGIIPDETYPAIWLAFHGFVAMVSFIGNCIYIDLYSYLFYKGLKSKIYTGPRFKKYLAYFGFSISIVLITLIITMQPIVEWILTILILLWILITSCQMIIFKFFNIPGIYYRRSKYPEALKRFEEALQILDRLDMSEDPITKTLKKNIEFLKSELEKKPKLME